jgi:hypothetical protein
VGGFTGPTISFGLTTLTNPVSINNHLEIFIAKLNVSIPEPVVDDSQLVDIYPNPVKDLLKVKYREGEVSDIKVTMYNLSGAEVFSGSYKNLNEFTIDVSAFPAASYFIELYNGENRTVKQVVKARSKEVLPFPAAPDLFFSANASAFWLEIPGRAGLNEILLSARCPHPVVFSAKCWRIIDSKTPGGLAS